MLSSQLFPPSSAFFCARARPSILMEPDGYIDPSFGDDGDVIDLGLLLLLQDQQQKSFTFIYFIFAYIETFCCRGVNFSGSHGVRHPLPIHFLL